MIGIYNDDVFSRAKWILTRCVDKLMFEIYGLLDEKDVNSLVLRVETHLLQLENTITDCFFPPPTKRASVDSQALEWWREEKKTEKIPNSIVANMKSRKCLKIQQNARNK